MVGDSVYAECIDQGILEFDVVSDRVVAYHTNFSGTVTVSPANDRVFVVDGSTSTVNILVPGGMPLSACQMASCI